MVCSSNAQSCIQAARYEEEMRQGIRSRSLDWKFFDVYFYRGMVMGNWHDMSSNTFICDQCLPT